MKKTAIMLTLVLAPAALAAQASVSTGVQAKGEGQASVQTRKPAVSAQASGSVDASADVKRDGANRSEQARSNGEAQASSHADNQASANASDRSVFEGMSAAGSAKLEAVLTSATEAHLPRRPIEDRVREGRAKGAAEAQLVAAAAQTKVRLEAAQHAIVRAGRSQPSDAEVSSGAEAMAQGATSAQIEGVAKHAQPGRSLTVAFETLARLAARGVPVAQAATQIETQLDARASDDAIGSIGAGAGTAVGAAAGIGHGLGAGATATGNAAAGVTGAAQGVGASATGTLSGAAGAVIRKP